MERAKRIGPPYFAVVCIVLLFSLFLLTNPRVASYYPQHYNQLRQSFLDDIQQKKGFDPQTYWKFREFYSPGNISFDPETVQFGETQSIYALPKDRSTLLMFTAPRLNSKDIIVKIDPKKIVSQEMNGVISEYERSSDTHELIFKDDTTRLYKGSDGVYELVFVKSIDEMEKVNGLFDYSDREKYLLQHTVWLNETKFW